MQTIAHEATLHALLPAAEFKCCGALGLLQ